MAANEQKTQIQLCLSVRTVKDKQTNTAVTDIAEKAVQTEDETLLCCIDQELKEVRRQTIGVSNLSLMKSHPYSKIQPLLAIPKQFVGTDGGHRVITK